MKFNQLLKRVLPLSAIVTMASIYASAQTISIPTPADSTSGSARAVVGITSGVTGGVVNPANSADQAGGSFSWSAANQNIQYITAGFRCGIGSSLTKVFFMDLPPKSSDINPASLSISNAALLAAGWPVKNPYTSSYSYTVGSLFTCESAPKYLISVTFLGSTSGVSGTISSPSVVARLIVNGVDRPIYPTLPAQSTQAAIYADAAHTQLIGYVFPVISADNSRMRLSFSFSSVWNTGESFTLNSPSSDGAASMLFNFNVYNYVNSINYPTWPLLSRSTYVTAPFLSTGSGTLLSGTSLEIPVESDIGQGLGRASNGTVYDSMSAPSRTGGGSGGFYMIRAPYIVAP